MEGEKSVENYVPAMYIFSNVSVAYVVITRL